MTTNKKKTTPKEKEPAFMMYSQDWIVGTMTMSFEDRGKYITLICMLHQSGRMTEKNVRLLVGSFSEELKSKFKIDEDGNWYNEKLERVTAQRQNFIESRRLNGLKGGRPKKTKEKNSPKKKKTKSTSFSVGYPTNNLPEDENEDVNKDENENEKKEDVFKNEILVDVKSEVYQSMTPTQKKNLHSQCLMASKIELPYTSQSFMTSFYDFLEHKAMIGHPYKTIKGLKAFFTENNKKCDEQEYINSFNRAVASGSYQTIYPEPKKQTYDKSKSRNSEANQYLQNNDPNYHNY